MDNKYKIDQIKNEGLSRKRCHICRSILNVEILEPIDFKKQIIKADKYKEHTILDLWCPTCGIKYRFNNE